MTIESLDMQRLLSALPLFSALSPLERVARGDLFFRVGEACEAVHIVVSGQIKLFVASHSGQEKVIEIIGPGRSFAEALPSSTVADVSPRFH